MIIIDNHQNIIPYTEGINEVYTSIGWGGDYKPDTIYKMFSASIYKLALANDKVVGLLRGYSDDVVETHITELAVHKTHQNNGYGRFLLKAMLEEYKHTTVYLTAFVENRGYFEKFGLINKSSRFLVYARKRYNPD